MLTRSPVTLDLAHPRVPCRITDVVADLADTNRLKALGLCPGHTVQLIQAGDPVIVEVCGTRLGVSARLAASVLIIDDGQQLSACA